MWAHGVVARRRLGVAADDVDHGRAPALERHVQQIGLAELEELAAEMLGAADAGRGVLEVAGLRLGERDQLLDDVGRQRGIDRDDFGPEPIAIGANALIGS